MLRWRSRPVHVSLDELHLVGGIAQARQAIQLAAAHPFAGYHAIEVRPLYRE
jgi:hypothetical protein